MSLQINNDIKLYLINIFKSCLNILRDNEGLTGEKALRNISYFLILKLIEPYLDNEINIDNYEYNLSHIDETSDDVEKYKRRLLNFARFSNLLNENENIYNIMTNLWQDILSEHPSTNKIFLKDKCFDIIRTTTYNNIIKKINSIDLSNTDHDILGNAYEEVIQDIMTGKVLGQFFTPPIIKNIMIDLINPKIYPDGKIDTCGDPTMGTGGFLITYLQNILKQFKLNNIKPDWDFIRNEGIYGKELEPDTYQLAVSNMLISSGHMFNKLERGDSIREPIIRKFDNILANPPFGIKGLIYDDFKNTLKDEYLPIKSDNAVSLFLQAIIYMLKIDGKCAIVLPDGQDLHNKTNNTLLSIREFLLKTCDLKEIIYLPSGIFTYTSIKTCIFFFIKKKEGNDILETIKSNKTIKYKFVNTHQTSNVKFYNFNDNIKTLLIDVPIEAIINNKYSLNYAEYIKKETILYNNDITIKSLGDICKFMPKSKRNAKYGNKDGLYPFFKSSIKINSYVDKYDYDEESLIIGDGGEPNINYGIKFSTSDHCYILQNKNKELYNLKYIYYYIFNNLNIMNSLYKGIGIKNISKTDIEKLEIPVPSLEKQKEIVEYCEFNDNLIKKLEKEINNNKEKSKLYLSSIINLNK